jgi:regulatory protein
MDRRITALKVQKKNPNRVNVYLDGRYAFGIARILAAYLKLDQSISDEKIAALQEKDCHEVALQKALYFINYRPRSEQEVRTKLLNGGFDELVVGKILERLIQGGVLGDEQFARNWIENRNTFRPRSKRLLALELRRKGIGGETIQSVLEEEGPDDALLSYQAASRYAHRLEGLEWQVFRKRLADYLARRGFQYAHIQAAVNKVWEETSPSGHSNNKIREEEFTNGK